MDIAAARPASSSVRQNRLDAAREKLEHVPTFEAPTVMPSLLSSSRPFRGCALAFVLALGRAAQAADGEGIVKVVPDFSVAGKRGTWSVTYTAGPAGVRAGGSI